MLEPIEVPSSDREPPVSVHEPGGVLIAGALGTEVGAVILLVAGLHSVDLFESNSLEALAVAASIVVGLALPTLFAASSVAVSAAAIDLA